MKTPIPPSLEFMRSRSPSTPSATTDVAAFDFTALREQIVSACREAFAEVRRAYPDDSICAFALYSDDGAMTVCPAFDLASALALRLAKDDDPAYEFCPPEWKLEGFGARDSFARICTTAREFVMQVQDDDFAAFRSELFETCLRALEQLRGEGALGGPEVLVLFAVSDCDPDPAEEILRVERLNGTSARAADYRRWVASWGGDD